MAEAGPYRPQAWDEALEADGVPRPAYVHVLQALRDADLGPAQTRLAALLEQGGVEFISTAGREVFHLDLVPRIVDVDEWQMLAVGLRQRAAALNAFICDVYAERRIVVAGHVPAGILETAEHYEPQLAGLPMPDQPATVIGFDLVRGADGNLVVLEDNARTPSGLAYAIAARETISQTGLPLDAPPLADPADSLEALRDALADATPATGRAILLSDGPTNSAWFEHLTLARRLELPLVAPSGLRRDGARLLALIEDEEHEVGLVYRRTDEDRLPDAGDPPTTLGELLFEPIRDGGLVVCNAFGSGVADDKLVHAYVEEMIRFYLGEEPLLGSVRSYDLSQAEAREQALDRLTELVVKPRGGLGGQGVVVCAHAEPADLQRIAAEIERRPRDYIAQETISLSTHPTVADGRLEPRHVDLRAYTVGGELVAAPLTRFARDRGALVVNSSEGGGAKDTWILK